MVTVRQSSAPIDLVTFPDFDGNNDLGVYLNFTGRCVFRVVGTNIENIEKKEIKEV